MTGSWKSEKTRERRNERTGMLILLRAERLGSLGQTRLEVVIPNGKGKGGQMFLEREMQEPNIRGRDGCGMGGSEGSRL